MMHLWKQSKLFVRKAVLVFVLLAVAAVALRYLPGFDEHALALQIRDKGAQGIFLFIAVAAVGSALGIPRQALSFAGGYAFGALSGLLYATIGTTLGCAGGFFLARYFGNPFVPKRLARRMEPLAALLARAPFYMTLTVRLMPFGNNALTNVLAGLSTIPPMGFIAGSCVGYLPQNCIFSLLGSGMRVDPFWRVLLAAVLFVLAMGTGFYLFRRHRALAALEKH